MPMAGAQRGQESVEFPLRRPRYLIAGMFLACLAGHLTIWRNGDDSAAGYLEAQSFRADTDGAVSGRGGADLEDVLADHFYVQPHGSLEVAQNCVIGHAAWLFAGLGIHVDTPAVFLPSALR